MLLLDRGSMGGAAQVAVQIISVVSAGRKEKAQLCITTPWDGKEPVPKGVEGSMAGASSAVTEHKEFCA